MNPNTKASWAQTPKTPTALTNGFLIEPTEKVVNGHRAFTTLEVGNYAIFCSRWSLVLALIAGTVSVLGDPFTQIHDGYVRVVTDVLLDVILRRPEAICLASTTF